MKTKLFIKFIICIFAAAVFYPAAFPYYTSADEQAFPQVNAQSAILMDVATGKTLYEKDSHSKMYPASITKVMTAIVVLENCKLDDVATVSNNAVSSLDSGYVTAGLQEGEELTTLQLLNMLLIASANDAAIVLAEHVSGNVQDFSALMNKKAKDLGCTGTNFVNPDGVHDENHYSTAYDLALIGRYAMQNDTFRSIVSNTSYTLPPTNKTSKERTFTTTNALLTTSSPYYYKYATGIKTGSTTPAGECLLASGSSNEFGLISVILNAKNSNVRFADTAILFNYAYSTYSLKKVAVQNQIIQTLNIKGATSSTKKLDILLQNDITAVINNSNISDNFMPEIKLNDNLKAPISKGDVVGTVTYTIDGTNYSSKLTASHNVKPSRMNIIIGIIAILLVLLILIRMINMNKRKRRLTSYKNHKQY
ncbi:MAG: D-alanyl-D-alanine carboxypeptidase [Firmicutes bacterium]|nr:D-alanyl-D-alanine carboxypeptidase [Bacillota bacterium]